MKSKKRQRLEMLERMYQRLQKNFEAMVQDDDFNVMLDLLNNIRAEIKEIEAELDKAEK